MTTVIRYIRRLSRWTELAIVLFAAFAPFMLGSALSLVMPSRESPLSEHHLHRIIVQESIVFMMLWGFLALRGWTFAHIGLSKPLWRDGAYGLLIGAATYSASSAILYVIWTVSPQMAWRIATVPLVAADGFTLPTIVIASLINPVFEEVFVCGYILSALSGRRNAWLGINLSMGIRLTYHLYQGAIAAVTIIPFGLACAFFFAKRGRLWPLIFAHVLFDFVGLVRHVP